MRHTHCSTSHNYLVCTLISIIPYIHDACGLIALMVRLVCKVHVTVEVYFVGQGPGLLMLKMNSHYTTVMSHRML